MSNTYVLELRCSTQPKLAPHLDSIVLVGAQAMYLHTGAADIVVAEFTTDADFSVEPALLSDEPLLAELLESRGFTPRERPGGWRTPAGVSVDIMVPEALRWPRHPRRRPRRTPDDVSHAARWDWKARASIANCAPSARSTRPTTAA
jgi:hypothetical protein